MSRIRIATRKSPLALWQAEHVAGLLRDRHPGLEVQLVPLTTKGDQILDRSLTNVGGKGLFVKELEVAMLEGRADIAVHSTKDVPAELPPGLTLGAMLPREDPRDALVCNDYDSLDGLPRGARVGTSSLRRQCQLRARRPDLDVRDLRGNVGTRLGRLDEGQLDAIVLASAGLQRLGLGHRIRQILDPEVCLPAIAQGAITIEHRDEDGDTMAWIGVLDDPDTAICVAAERALNRGLGGSCQVPVGGYGELRNQVIHLRGLVGRPDGREIIAGEIQGPAGEAVELGQALAADLLGRGGGRILEALFPSR